MTPKSSIQSRWRGRPVLFFTAVVALSAACELPTFGGSPTPSAEPATTVEPTKPSDEPSNEKTNENTDEPGAAASADDDCDPAPPPPERVDGNLTVRHPPDEDTRSVDRRMRSHLMGSLSASEDRHWVGPPVPGFVPLREDSAELNLLERSDGVVLAFYRDMYDAATCGLGNRTNCDFFVRAWDECGRDLWARRLNDFMSRPDHLEVQDIRFADGVLYFNEACQSYSKEADGECSAMVAIAPQDGELLWRSEHLVSNDVFLVHGDYLITGYGFTAEPDYLYLIRRRDGEVVQRVAIETGHEKLRIEDDAILIVDRYSDTTERFRLKGFDGEEPKLVRD